MAEHPAGALKSPLSTVETAERIEGLMGPDPADPDAYWRELAGWPDWTPWLPEESSWCEPEWRRT